MHIRQRLYLRCRSVRVAEKRRLLSDFKTAQRSFDRRLRFHERRHRKGLVDKIESVCTDDPRRFWNHIQKLGPKRNSCIPMEVYDDHGQLLTDKDIVLDAWKRDFSSLYNNPDGDYDEDFLNQIIHHKGVLENNMIDPLHESNVAINQNISLEEVEKVVNKVKRGKSVGIDRIPGEVLKNDVSISVLHNLFQLCFDSGLIPDVWRFATIVPIPKDRSADPRIPLNYRGISLQSVICKLYCSILNARLFNYSSRK
ncbi:uncharacterized protein LOC144438131 [Glandiceps talaboti]